MRGSVPAVGQQLGERLDGAVAEEHFAAVILIVELTEEFPASAAGRNDRSAFCHGHQFDNRGVRLP